MKMLVSPELTFRVKYDIYGNKVYEVEPIKIHLTKPTLNAEEMAELMKIIKKYEVEVK